MEAGLATGGMREHAIDYNHVEVEVRLDGAGELWVVLEEGSQPFGMAQYPLADGKVRQHVIGVLDFQLMDAAF